MTLNPQFESERVIEIVAPKYGSGYRIGGRLVLTCKHLFKGEKECQVRFRYSDKKENIEDIEAKVIWCAPGDIDIALVALPDKYKSYPAIRFGELPDGGTVKFVFLGWPEYRDCKDYATGLPVRGSIDTSTIAPHNLLLLDIDDNSLEVNSRYFWQSLSRSA